MSTRQLYDSPSFRERRYDFRNPQGKAEFRERIQSYREIDALRQNYRDELDEQRNELCFWSILVGSVLTGVAIIGIILLCL